MQGTAREAVFKEWDLLDPRYRYKALPEKGRAFAYSLSRQVRVRVEPPGKWATASRGEPEVYVERRSGPSRRLIRRGEHQWMRVLPLDVSDYRALHRGTEAGF
ncbi:MAG: hypothetical protein RMM08_02070, partial [Armatimonadota bacterium]|nr:hypothetical protein [Armatimonadota bacterium]